MRALPLPDRAQPLSVSYVYTLAEQLNEVISSLASTASTLSTVDNGISRKDASTENLRFYAKTKTSFKVGSVDANKTDSWSEDFNPPFKTPPVVTATPINNNASSAGNDVTIVIKNVTTGRVDGEIVYHTSGSIDVSINVLAVGVN
jgi:hypothetical protein